MTRKTEGGIAWADEQGPPTLSRTRARSVRARTAVGAHAAAAPMTRQRPVDHAFHPPIPHAPGLEGRAGARSARGESLSSCLAPASSPARKLRLCEQGASSADRNAQTLTPQTGERLTALHRLPHSLMKFPYFRNISALNFTAIPKARNIKAIYPDGEKE